MPLTAAHVSDLRTMIESALAASVAENGGVPRSQTASAYHLPADHVWALVNPGDTRAVLTDRAVKALGGRHFAVTIDPANGVTITATDPVAPAPAEPDAHG